MWCDIKVNPREMRCDCSTSTPTGASCSSSSPALRASRSIKAGMVKFAGEDAQVASCRLSDEWRKKKNKLGLTGGLNYSFSIILV